MAGLTERERALRVERKELYTAIEPLIEKIGLGEKLSVEEQADFDQRNKKITDLGTELQTVVAARDLKGAEGSGDEPDTRGVQGATDDREKREAAAFDKWFRYGDTVLTSEDRAVLRPQYRGMGESEYRTGPGGDTAPMQVSPLAVAITGGSAGGYMVPPAFWQNLQIALKAYGGVYPHFRQVDTATGAPMSWPTTNPTATVAALLTENTIVTPQDETFGLGQLLAWTYVAGPFLASIQLLNDGAFDLDAFLRDRIAEAIGRAQAAAAWSGSGSSQPLGLTAALVAQGSASVGTGGVYLEAAARTVQTFAGSQASESVAGAMNFETVFQLISMVDPAYRGVSNAGPSVTPGNPAWYMSDTTLQNERQVTDLYGRPLIQQSVNMGGNTLGETLAGYPVVIDNNAPVIAGNAAPTVAEVSGPVFGSLSHAMVARNVRQTGVMVLRERYADYLAVAWLGFMRYDIRSNDMRAAASVSYHS
jgi:HK97 family phage major capsid protein